MKEYQVIYKLNGRQGKHFVIVWPKVNLSFGELRPSIFRQLKKDINCSPSDKLKIISIREVEN